MGQTSVRCAVRGITGPKTVPMWLLLWLAAGVFGSWQGQGQKDLYTHVNTEFLVSKLFSLQD